jgi:hypothetical protein
MSNSDESVQPVTLPAIMAYLQESMAEQKTAIADLQAQIETINAAPQTGNPGLANPPHPELDTANSPNSQSQGTDGPDNVSPQIDPTGIRGGLKLPKPDNFSGGISSDISNWIFTIDNLYLSNHQLSESFKIAYATGYLSGHARSWWQLESTNPPRTWVELKERMLKYFESPTKTRDAKDRLYSLTQEKADDFEKYKNTFQRLVVEARLTNEGDKVFSFIRGLRPFTRGHVESMDPSSLFEAITLASKWERSYRRENANGSGTKSFLGDAGRKQTHQGQGRNLSALGVRKDSFTKVPFKSSQTQRDGRSILQMLASKYKKTPVEIESLKKQGLCFVCGAKGHSAKMHDSSN